MNEGTRRYEVFARSQRGGPLCHVGMVETFSDALAEVMAYRIYDEESWFDLAVVPSDHFNWIVRQGRTAAWGERG